MSLIKDLPLEQLAAAEYYKRRSKMSKIKNLPNLSLEQLDIKWHMNNQKIERAEELLDMIHTMPTGEHTIKLLKVTSIDAINDTVNESLETLDQIEYWMSKHTEALLFVTNMKMPLRFSHFKRGEAQ